MNDYQLRMAAAAEETRALVTEIAGALGTDWKVEETSEPMSHGAHIVGPDDVYLFVRDQDQSYARANERGKVEISTSVYKLAGYENGDAYRYGDEKRPEIMVSKSRGAATIAKEIRRRLLPAAIEESRATRERIAKRIANANAAQTVADELAAMMPGTYVRDERSGRRQVSGIGRLTSGMFGHLEVSHDGTHVDIDVRGLSLVQARAIAEVLAKS